MQTATMQFKETAKDSPFATIAENEKENPAPFFRPEDDRPRYLFFAGDMPGMEAPGGMSVQTPCVPAKRLRRCQVTPCVTVQWPARLVEIPEGRIIRGTEDFRPGFGKFFMYSGSEADILLADYARSGLIELAPEYLRGKDWREVVALNITGTFFPNWPNDVPETNPALIDYLEQKVEEINQSNAYQEPFVTGEGKPITVGLLYLQCGMDMIRAARQAHQYQSEIVGQTNIAVTLPSTEAGYKRNFDERDQLFSKRSGVDLAINSLRQNTASATEKTAEAIKELAEKLQPQTATLNPEVFGAAVAAAIKAMNAPEPSPDTKTPKKAA